MKSFKKIISLVLVLSIVSLCAACSSNNGKKDKKSHTRNREETEVTLEETLEETDYTTVPEVDLPHDEAVASAREVALDFVGFAHYSRNGMFSQLTSPYTYHYPEDVVNEALDSIEEEGLVDWNQEAFELATNLIDSWAYSYQSLINEMTYFSNGTGFGFTLEEATNAVNRLEEEKLVDWNEEALEAAQNYLTYDDTREYTREDMIEQLTFTGDMGDSFTMEQALYAVDHLGL